MSLFGFKFTKLRIFIMAVVVAIMMSHPTLRAIVWWILPLGSGWDDIVFIVAVSIIVILGFVEMWTSEIPNNPYNRKNK